MTQLFHFVLIFFFQRKSNINSDESQNVKFHGWICTGIWSQITGGWTWN